MKTFLIGFFLCFTFSSLVAQRVATTYFFYFESSQYELNTPESKKLNSVCDTLSNFKIVSVSITGHTDDTDTEEENLILSEKRANAVKEILVERKISEEKITVVALGETNPLESNKSEKGKARNRRVEVKVVYE